MRSQIPRQWDPINGSHLGSIDKAHEADTEMLCLNEPWSPETSADS